jgi:hypothetical protein
MILNSSVTRIALSNPTTRIGVFSRHAVSFFVRQKRRDGSVTHPWSTSESEETRVRNIRRQELNLRVLLTQLVRPVRSLCTVSKKRLFNVYTIITH